MSADYRAHAYGAFLLRLLLGALFLAHLYWKLALFPGGLGGWWAGLLKSGYPKLVPAYVLCAEIAGALFLIPGVLTRWVAAFAVPMMVGAVEFWLVRTGFYFTKSGAELPLVWLALLCIQIVLGDGAFALVRSDVLIAPAKRRHITSQCVAGCPVRSHGSSGA